MNNNEFSNQFDVLYNNIMSNEAPGLNEYEKSVFLTKAQDEIVKNHFNPKSNSKTEGFDDTAKRQADFSMLLKTYHSSNPFTFENSQFQQFDPRSLSYVLPSDLFITVNESLIISKPTIDCVGFLAGTGMHKTFALMRYVKEFMPIFDLNFDMFKLPQWLINAVYEHHLNISDSGVKDIADLTQQHFCEYYVNNYSIAPNKNTVYHCILVVVPGVESSNKLLKLNAALNSSNNTITFSASNNIDSTTISRELATILDGLISEREKEVDAASDVNNEYTNDIGIYKILARDTRGKIVDLTLSNALNDYSELYVDVYTDKEGYIAGVLCDALGSVSITPIVSNTKPIISVINNNIKFSPEIEVSSGKHIYSFLVKLKDDVAIKSKASNINFVWRNKEEARVNFEDLNYRGIPLEIKVGSNSGPNGDWADNGVTNTEETVSTTMLIEEGYSVAFGRVPLNTSKEIEITLNISNNDDSEHEFELETDLDSDIEYTIDPETLDSVVITENSSVTQKITVSFEPTEEGRYLRTFNFILKLNNEQINAISCNLSGVGVKLEQINPNTGELGDLFGDVTTVEPGTSSGTIEPWGSGGSLKPTGDSSSNNSSSGTLPEGTEVEGDTSGYSYYDYANVKDSFIPINGSILCWCNLDLIGNGKQFKVIRKEVDPDSYRDGVRTILPISFVDYRRLMSKPYKEPLKWQAWRLITNADSNNTGIAEIIPTSKDRKLYDRLVYDIRYVKRPRPIILANFSDAYGEGITIQGKDGSEVIYSNNDQKTKWDPCELDPILHEEILQRAVELAKIAWTGDANSSVQTGTRSE